MNSEPPPPETKPDMYVIHGYSDPMIVLIHCFNRPDGRGWSSHSRALDLAEEDYFNADDDEEELLPTISQQWFRGTGATSPLLANNTGMKRKRRIGMSSQTKGYRPLLKTPRLSALVDYDEDEEECSSNDQPTPSIQGTSPKSIPADDTPSSVPTHPNRSPGPQPSPTPTTNITTPTPSLSSGPPPKRSPKAEDDDNLLEALARPRARSQASSPTPGISIGLMRPSEKRRRADDDDDGDDELLERLSKSSSKKSDPNNQKEAFTIRPKNGDDPPAAKKIKVKFGAVGLAVASSSPTSAAPTVPTRVDGATLSSKAGMKDGDIG